MNGQEDIRERISALVKESGFAQSAFALECGLDASNFAKKMKGVQPFTARDIAAVSKCMRVSPEWLMTGEGLRDPAKRAGKKGAKGSAVNRLMDYLNYKGIAPSAAESACGLSNGLLGKAYKSGAALGSDKLEKVLSVYPDLSAEWLLRGRGEMSYENSKAHELEIRLERMGKGNGNEAYSVLLSMLDMMSKTYRFFSEEK